MKRVKKIILMFVLSFLFITSIKAENFTCKIGDYNVEYNDLGNIIGAKTLDGTAVKDRIFTSYFKPKNNSECPKDDEDEVTVKLMEDGVGNDLFIVAALGVHEIDKNLGGCSGYTYKKSCEHNKYYSCIWNENDFGTYCNTDKLIYVQCGDAFDIPHEAPKIISLVVNLLKIAAPIILIIVSIISLLKAISASNEDEIKKAQKGLIRKITAATMVFFVISIVQFVVMKVADTDNSSGASEADNLSNCLSCFLNNDCGANAYYKTNLFGEYECTYLGSKEKFDCN